MYRHDFGCVGVETWIPRVGPWPPCLETEAAHETVCNGFFEYLSNETPPGQNELNLAPSVRQLPDADRCRYEP
jgi:hypothetical protein